MNPGATAEDDRRAINDLVLRYCRAVDRLDYHGIRAVYADDGVDHHTGFSGPATEPSPNFMLPPTAEGPRARRDDQDPLAVLRRTVLGR